MTPVCKSDATLARASGHTVDWEALDVARISALNHNGSGQTKQRHFGRLSFSIEGSHVYRI